jgi:FG-GAP-like repeat
VWPAETLASGVAAADYDGDGWTDLLVTTYGRLILYHNNHDGTFTDVTTKAHLAEPGLFTSAVWFDYDNNGTPESLCGALCQIQEVSGTRLQHPIPLQREPLGGLRLRQPRFYRRPVVFP